MLYNTQHPHYSSQIQSSGSQPSIILGPATHTTVVTTTTTTTTTYAPINLPPLVSPSTIKDPKLYPLLNAPLPRSLRKFPLTFPGGARAMFQDPSCSDEDVGSAWVDDQAPSGEGWQQVNHGSSAKEKEAVVGLPDALDRFSVRKRVHSESGRFSPADDLANADVVMGAADDPARSPPPRKKARASEAAPINSSTSRQNGGPPSPLPSPQPSPASAVLWAPNPSPPQAPPFQPDVSLTALLALPELLNQYVSLPQALQSHYIFTLLRHSPLPVLRTIHSVLTPTLARDFVGMLPPELASYILQFLPPAALFSAAKVSHSWRTHIDSDATIWINLLKRTGTWFGGPSENAFARRVGEYRERHPPSPLPGGRTPLKPPHPLKLLFKSRRTVLSRWTQKTPKRLTFAAHGASVVTCLLFSRRRIISASDDHSIHIYDPVTGQQLRMLEGHDGGVWALAVCSRRIATADLNAPPQYYDVLVSGSTDRTVRIWDLSTGRNTHVFGGHTSTVRCLAIVRPTWVEREDGSGILEKWPKRTLIVTGSRDHSLRIWRLPGRHDDEYRCKGADPEDDPAEEDVRLNPFHLRLLEGHAHAVRALAAHGRTLVSGSYDATVRVWDIITGECKFILSGHTQKVYSVVLDPVRRQACSGSMDGSVRIWSLKTGQNLHTLNGHSSLVGLLSLSPTTLVSAAADSTLRIWDPTTGAPLHVLQAHQGAITCFQHDEFKVLSGSDGALKMWDTRDGTVMRDLLTNIMGVWQVVFDERFCVAASNLQDHTFLDVWDFGDDGDADVEAVRIVEDEDESEDEDDPSGIDEDDDDDDDEDALMVDASTGSSTGTRRMETTPGPHERSSSEDIPLAGPGTGNAWRAWGSGAAAGESSPFHFHPAVGSLSPSYDAPSLPYPSASPSFSPGHAGEERQFFGREETYLAGPSKSGPSVQTRLPPTRADAKGKGRALPPNMASPAPNPHAEESTPPTSSTLVAPPNPHSSSWAPSAYTIQASQSTETPTKPRPRRHGR